MPAAKPSKKAPAKRNRRSSIDRLPEPVRKAIDREFKAGRLTIDQLLDKIRSEFGKQLGDDVPSRSALGRARKSFDEIAKEHREAMDIARVWAQEIGQDPDGDIGGAVVQVLRTLAWRGVRDAYDEGLTPKDLSVLSLAAQRIETAGQLSLKSQMAIRKAALDEAAAKVDKLTKTAGKHGFDVETLKRVRQEIYGLTE